MKTFALLLALLFTPALPAGEAGAVMEIEVRGLTCPFCIYGVEKNLSRLSGVAGAEVSLDEGIARITLQPGQKIDPALLRKAILDAGFTPGDIREAGNR